MLFLLFPLPWAGCTLGPAQITSIDDALHQEGPRHGTLGPTGKRLFADRLDEGFGIRGQFGYIHHADIRDPMRLSFSNRGERLDQKIERTDWYPSHLSVYSTVGEIGVHERKYITDDDTLVVELELFNTSTEPIEHTLRLDSGFARSLEREGSTFTTVDLSAVANAHPFPGHDIFTGREPLPFRAWFEAEHSFTRSGTGHLDARAAASGGEVLGSEFGGNVGDSAVYEFATPAMASAHLYFRVARGEPDPDDRPAVWSVWVDGIRAGQLKVASTGGWGDRDEQFHWVHLPLDGLLAGGHTLRLDSDRAEKNRTNFDGFYISVEPFQPPPTAADGALARDRIEQVPYRPARQILEGVPFTFIDPKENEGLGVIIARRSSDRDRRRRTDSIVIPIPAGDADMIHFCGQVAGRLDEVAEGAVVAEYELQFGDGETERILLTAGDTLRPISAGPGVLSHPLSRDRDLVRVEFRPRGRAGEAVLTAITIEQYPADGPDYHLVGSELFAGVRAHAAVTAGGFEAADEGAAMTRTIQLEPGASTRLRVTMSFADTPIEAARRSHDWEARPDALSWHIRTYQSWFDQNCPQFSCDDPYITKLYWYRWFVARNCLSRAEAGNLRFPCFFEGMHDRSFPRLTTFSSPHIIAETRWLRDPQYVYGHIRNVCLNADDENQYLVCVRANEKQGHYANWIPAAAWDALRVHPDTNVLKEVIAILAGDVLGTFRQFDRDGDFLCTATSHWSTGMQFQPAFFFFDEFDDSRPDAHLERPDFAAYSFANARAVAQAYRELGLTDEARRFEVLAGNVRDACLSKMWDDEDRLCYSIRESDDAVAPVPEIVAFYPFMARMFPDETRYTATLGRLVDPAEFWTSFPPATVSRQCPAYTPVPATWPGPGGRTDERMWNGPPWPHATSVILNVLSVAVREYRHVDVRPEHFWHMLDRYTHMQFEKDNLGRPLVREYANGETGEMRGCPDYFHSTYCDLVIRCLVGLEPDGSDRLILRPIPGPLKRFSLRGVRYRGHNLDIIYEAQGGNLGQEPAGLSVWVDGRWAGNRGSLGEMTIDLAQSGGTAFFGK